MEIANISSVDLPETENLLKAYVVNDPGKYKISVYGEAGGGANIKANGGILKAAKYFNSSDIIKIKAIRGSYNSGNSSWGGAGVAIYENNVVKMAVGGGATYYSGGGAGGGYLNDGGSGLAGAPGGSICIAPSPSIPPMGTPGGKGYCASSYCNDENYYEAIPGGNAVAGNLAPQMCNISAGSGGNTASNALTGGKGYASIMYCGPYPDSVCPQ